MVHIEVTAAPSSEERGVIDSGLVAFNQARADAMKSEPLAVLVRDEAGAVVGGLVGRTIAKWLHVQLFWLPEALRGGGLGARVVARAEGEAARRGCIGAYLDTHSFQAPSFYRRLGYEVFGAIGDQPPGHERIFLRKRFDDRGAAAARGEGQKSEQDG